MPTGMSFVSRDCRWKIAYTNPTDGSPMHVYRRTSFHAAVVECQTLRAHHLDPRCPRIQSDVSGINGACIGRNIMFMPSIFGPSRAFPLTLLGVENARVYSKEVYIGLLSTEVARVMCKTYRGLSVKGLTFCRTFDKTTRYFRRTTEGFQDAQHSLDKLSDGTLYVPVQPGPSTLGVPIRGGGHFAMCFKDGSTHQFETPPSA